MVKRALAVQLKRAPGYFVGTVLLAALGACATVAEYWAVANIVNDVFFRKSSEAVDHWLSWGLLALGLRIVLGGAAEAMALRLSTVIRCGLREDMARHLIAGSPLLAEGRSIGELMGIFLEGIDVLDRYYRSYLPQIVRALLLPVIYLCFIFPKDWLSGLIFLVTLPLIPFFMMLIGRWTRQNSERQWQLLKTLAAYLQDVLRGLETLKLLGRSKAQGAQIYEISERYRRTTLQVQRWAFLSSMVLELMSTISIAVVAVGLGLRLVEGDMLYLAAFFILLMAPEYYQPMRELGSFFHASMDADAVADDLLAWTAPQEKAEEAALRIESLRFENVSYRYPGREDWALRDVSFCLHAGESLALVGPSGSGKTTLFYLALGFLAPTEGKILVNGSIDPFNHAPYQERLAYLPQTPAVFRGSVADNISLFEAAPDQARLQDALRESGLEALWPGNEILSEEVGDGANPLSGGQQALLSLARVFYREADLVFLDEPTDNLDLISEERVVRGIDRLLARSGSMTIAHRLHTVRHADRVLFLQEGRLIGDGPWETLEATLPAFRRMIRRDGDA